MKRSKWSDILKDKLPILSPSTSAMWQILRLNFLLENGPSNRQCNSVKYLFHKESRYRDKSSGDRQEWIQGKPKILNYAIYLKFGSSIKKCIAKNYSTQKYRPKKIRLRYTTFEEQFLDIWFIQKICYVVQQDTFRSSTKPFFKILLLS